MNEAHYEGSHVNSQPLSSFGQRQNIFYAFARTNQNHLTGPWFFGADEVSSKQGLWIHFPGNDVISLRNGFFSIHFTISAIGSDPTGRSR
jgi:hypothetical protein